MRLPLALFAVLAAVIFAAWWWIGMPVQMPPSPLEPGEKLNCVSYAPFRPGQSPFDPTTRIEPWQIDEDLALLAGVTRCVRTYSADFGLDHVPEIAKRHGLKVIQGLWLSGEAEKNRFQVQTTIELAKRYPEVITAVVVGNEVLLRGEMAAADLLNFIRTVKSQVPVQVTYADVWEFWLRNPALLEAVDFVTIHILPYWEDFPIPAKEAGAHIDSIRKRVAAAFPGKEILIGETGWPSAGRMREGALPSPVSQALVLHDVLTLAKRESFRVNLIEAFDQPWKRLLEGTVGGHWGLLDADSRDIKFTWGGAVSNHPLWLWQALAGVAWAFLTFAAAWTAARRRTLESRQWLATAATALAPGILIGWAIENALVESFGLGGALRSLAIVAVALAAPLLAAAAVASGVSVPSFAQVLARAPDRLRDPLRFALGAILVLLGVLALERALGLAFDPRYRDFGFAPLTAAIIPFLVLSFARPLKGVRGAAETATAAVLALCAIYVAINEGFANWQALWCSGTLLALALTLLRLRAAPG
jgi:exo-beta-1,3-glucanase (GH17 family)